MEPTFERLDDRMQDGYDLSGKDPCGCCGIWLQAWRDFLTICDRDGITAIDDFDRRFHGVQDVFNWVQDLEAELHNAGLDNSRFFEERKALCAEFLERFATDSLTAQNMRRALAESAFELGEVEETDRLFRAWLDSDPQWGWGWVGWSDCYWLFGRKDRRDPDKGEAILKEGLAVEGIRDREEILERLADLYKEEGKAEEATAVRRKLEHSRQQAERRSGAAMYPRGSVSGAPSPIRSAAKIGRNDPCPCGSGKKFKKCCGKA